MGLRWYFVRGRGLGESSRKAKNSEIEAYASASTSLVAFLGDCEEGVWLVRSVKVDDL